jgi:hypothetical protein
MTVTRTYKDAKLSKRKEKKSDRERERQSDRNGIGEATIERVRCSGTK